MTGNMSASEQFHTWLDSVATPVDTSEPIVEPGRDYARERHDKREAIRHRWLMRNNIWYRGAYHDSQKHEQLRLAAELRGEVYVEPEPLTSEQPEFWDQFTKEK
jgi:hypothetical protein